MTHSGIVRRILKLSPEIFEGKKERAQKKKGHVKGHRANLKSPQWTKLKEFEQRKKLCSVVL